MSPRGPYLHRTQVEVEEYPHNTVNLELPSISQVHSRGAIDEPWYNPQYAPRPNERLPALPHIQAHGSSSSSSSSPRGGSFSANSAVNSASSHTSYSTAGHGGFKTPSPEQTPHSLGRDHHAQDESPYSQQSAHGYAYTPVSYSSMNQMQSYSDVHHPHMSAPQHGQVSGPTSGLSHYAHYQQPQILQPSPSSYPSQANYAPNGYGYGVQQSPGSGHPVTSSMGSQLVSNSQTLPGACDPSLPSN